MAKKEVKEVKAVKVVEPKPTISLDSSRLEVLEALVEKLRVKVNQLPNCGDKI